MIWADVFEANLDRLRRYAILATGKIANGDDAIVAALENMLADDSPPVNASLCGAFTGVDIALRETATVIPLNPAGKSRWYKLTSLERRLILLVEMEGFSLRDAAKITGLTFHDMTAGFASARLKYADRFPARVCLIGEDSDDAAHLAQAITRLGHAVVWTTNDISEAESGLQNNPTVAMVMATGQGSKAVTEKARRLNAMFPGPVITASVHADSTDPDLPLYVVPWPGIVSCPQFRRSLTQTLLFMQ